MQRDYAGIAALVILRLHADAYGPKGFSVCMFRGQELRKGQFFACMNWPGGFYATTTMAGSRPVGGTLSSP